MPLTEKSKRYVEKRVEEKCTEMRVKLYQAWDENDEDMIGKNEIITSMVEGKLMQLYTKGVSYWKAKGDEENSNRAAYALTYFYNVYRFRFISPRDRS